MKRIDRGLRFAVAAWVFLGGLFLARDAVTRLLTPEPTAAVTFRKEAQAFGKETVLRQSLFAKAYNDAIPEGTLHFSDPFSSQTSREMPTPYADMLTLQGSIGWLRIPKLGLTLPIAAQSDAAALSHGVQHLAGSSLPIGGPGTHTLLAADRGSWTERRFSDLNELDEGDRFYIENMAETLAYQVRERQVLSPSSLASLRLESTKDRVSLVTFTPSLFPTQRLVVQADRIEYQAEMERSDQRVGKRNSQDRLIGEGLLYLIGGLFLSNLRHSYRRFCLKKRRSNLLREIEM